MVDELRSSPNFVPVPVYATHVPRYDELRRFRTTEVSSQVSGGFVPIFWRFRPHLNKFTIGYVIQPFSWIFRVILARNKLKITRELHTRKKKQKTKNKAIVQELITDNREAPFLPKPDNLLYALMSGKRKDDYRAVFKAVRASIADLRLQEAVMDFEAAMWAGFKAIFPGKSIKGCVFHWVQAVWRHVQGVGLQEAYNKDAGTHSFLRKLMALPFLPHEHVLQTFLHLNSLAVGDQLTWMCT